MFVILPKHWDQKPLKFLVTDDDGKSFEAKIINNQTDSILETLDYYNKQQYDYIFEKLNYPNTYSFIQYSPIEFYSSLEEIMANFLDFIIVVDETDQYSLLPTIEKPKNSFADVYSTKIYRHFSKLGLEPTTYFYYNYRMGRYERFKGKVEYRQKYETLIVPPNLIRVANNCGYFDIGGIKLYVVSKLPITSEGVQSSYAEFQKLPIISLKLRLLEKLLYIYSLFNILPESGTIAKSDSEEHWYLLGENNQVVLFCGTIPYNQFIAENI